MNAITRRLPRTTFGLATLISAVLCALMIVTGIIGRHFAHEELEEQLDHRIRAETSLLTAEYERVGRQALIAAIRARQKQHRGSDLGYRLVAADGKHLAGDLEAKMPKPGWEEHLRTGHGKDADEAQALTTLLSDGSRLLVATSREPVIEVDTMLAWITAATTLAMLLMGVAGAWILGWITRRRIDRINEVAQAITDGDTAQRMPRNIRDGEFDRLAETLNRMLDRNAELMSNLRQVSTDIAHDLRTPLGRQRQMLELALNECTEIEEYRQAIEAAAAAGDEMLQLFSAMLKISEIESLGLRASFSRVDLSKIVHRVAEAFQPDVEDSDHSLELDIGDGIGVNGERHLLSQLIVNLIENAMRHTPVGTRIRIRLSGSDQNALLCIEDNGPGIAAIDHARVLKRFVRLEYSRSTPGNGLGLSLVKAIADAHSAKLLLEDARPGLRVTVQLARF
jgi:signal transduction histidine kinase